MAKNKSMYKFEIIETVIKSLDCSSKDQVVTLAKKMRDIALKDNNLAEEIKQAFIDAVEVLEDKDLSLANIKEIKAMLD